MSSQALTPKPPQTFDVREVLRRRMEGAPRLSHWFAPSLYLSPLLPPLIPVSLSQVMREPHNFAQFMREPHSFALVTLFYLSQSGWLPCSLSGNLSGNFVLSLPLSLTFSLFLSLPLSLAHVAHSFSFTLFLHLSLSHCPFPHPPNHSQPPPPSHTRASRFMRRQAQPPTFRLQTPSPMNWTLSLKPGRLQQYKTHWRHP